MCYEGAWILENTEGFPSLKFKKKFFAVYQSHVYRIVCANMCSVDCIDIASSGRNKLQSRRVF